MKALAPVAVSTDMDFRLPPLAPTTHETVLERPLPGLTALDDTIDLAEEVASGETQPNGSVLLGSWDRDAQRRPVPARDGDYAAVLQGDYVLVVWSRTAKRVALSKLQGLGAGHLNEPGEHFAYCLPSALYVDRDE